MIVIEHIVAWIVRHRYLTLFGLIFLSLCYAVFLFLSSYAIIHITLTGKYDASLPVTTYTSSASETKKISSTSGWSLVGRDTDSLIIQSGKQLKTHTPLSIPWYGYVNKNIVLKSDKDAIKVAYRSKTGATCVTYDQQSNKLLYYDCRNPTSLLQYNAPDTGSWAVSKVADLIYSGDKIAPYRGGVLGMQSSVLKAVYANKTSSIYSLPSSIGATGIGQLTIFTDTSDPNNANFIIVDGSGNIYLGVVSPDKKSVNYKTISAPADYNSQNYATLCTLRGDSAYCLRSLAGLGDAPDNNNGKTDSSLMKASFSSGENSTKKVSTLTGADTIAVTKAGDIYIKNYKDLFYLDESSSNYKPVNLAQNVDSISTGDSLYYAEDKGLFSIDSKASDSYQLFYSPNIDIKRVYASGEKVFMLGNADNDTSMTYAYQMIDDYNSSPGSRIIDKLPTLPSNIPDTLSNDLVGDKLYVQISMSYSAPRLEFEALLSQRKENVINYLNTNNIQISESNIIFNY